MQNAAGGPTEGPGRRYSLREARESLGWTFSRSEGTGKDLRRITLLSVGISVGGLLVPLLIGQVIDGLPDLGRMARPVALLLLCFALSAGLENLQGRTVARMSQRLVRDLRGRLCGRLLRMPVGVGDRHPRGDWMSRVTNDTENVARTLTGALPQLLSSAVTVAGCLLMMGTRSRTMTLIALGFCLVALIPAALLSRPMLRLSRAQQACLGSMNAQAAEILDQRESIWALDSREAFLARFEDSSRTLERAGIRAQLLGAGMEPLMALAGTLAFVCCVAAGARELMEGRMSLGAFQACLVFTRQMIRPVSGLGMVMAQLNGCLACIGRLREADALPGEAGGTGALSGGGAPAIELRDVSFSYMRDRGLFEHLSLTFEAGKTTAIVGPTGAGKTSLLSLLLKFYAPDQGKILIGGQDLAELPGEEIYRRTAVVLQDCFMMPGTVAECIAASRPEATREEIEAAARLTGAEEFIRRLPLGYNEPIESEQQLSRGQWQLIALSAAALSNAPIFLLDEATSSIDTCSERRIQEALGRLRKDRTCVIIAHRLSTIRDADRILLMENGAVTEEGNHESLMARRGAYYRLYTSGDVICD